MKKLTTHLVLAAGIFALNPAALAQEAPPYDCSDFSMTGDPGWYGYCVTSQPVVSYTPEWWAELQVVDSGTWARVMAMCTKQPWKCRGDDL